MRTKEPTYRDLADYIERTGKRKSYVARKELGIDPATLSRLLKPNVWKPSVDEAMIAKIATLLRRSESYVREYYRKASAA